MAERQDDRQDEISQEWLHEADVSHVTHRREFLGRIAQLSAAAMGWTLMNGSEAEAAKKVRKRPQQEPAGKNAKKKPDDVSIEKINDNTYVIGKWEAEKDGEGLRGPSEYPPEGWELHPVTFDNDVIVDMGRRKLVKIQYLVPIPRDLGECARHKSELTIDIKGVNDQTITVKPIVSQPNNNQFLEIAIEGKAAAQQVVLHPKMTSWITQGSKAPVSGPQLLPRYGNSPRLQTAISAYNQTKSGMIYDASMASLDPKDVLENRRGDCGSVSVFGKCATGGAMEVVIGWSQQFIDKGTGGKHSWNVSRLGNWVTDSAGDYYGRDSEAFIPASVGNEFIFPKGTPEGSYIKKFAMGTNTGYILAHGMGIAGSSTDQVQFSTPGHGIRGLELQQLALNPPADVKAAHDTFVAERRQINQNPQVAAGVAKKR